MSYLLIGVRQRAIAAALLGALCIPRPDPGETDRRDSSDVTWSVPHRSRWILSIWSQIDSGQALQEIHCAAFGHARGTVNHHVFAQPFRVCLIAKQGQRNSRVALNVPNLFMRRHVADYELFVFYSDPHHGDLRAAV